MPKSHLEILLAEDDENDVELMDRAFKDAGVRNPVRVVRDGQAAIDYLAGLASSTDDRAPALILLDLKLPRKDGMQVLEWVRNQTTLQGVPVFILSSSNQLRDVEPAYARGAAVYIVKPAGTMERAQIARFIDHWLHTQVPCLAVSRGVRASLAFHSTWTRHRRQMP